MKTNFKCFNLITISTILKVVKNIFAGNMKLLFGNLKKNHLDVVTTFILIINSKINICIKCCILNSTLKINIRNVRFTCLGFEDNNFSNRDYCS